MPQRMKVAAHAQAQEGARVALKYFEALVTIVVGGVDIDIMLVNLRRFIEEHCIVRLCSIEREGALTHKHFQMVLKVILTVCLF